MATSIEDDFDEKARASCEYEASEAAGWGTTFTLMPVSRVKRAASMRSRLCELPTESPTKVIVWPPYFALIAAAFGTGGGLTAIAPVARVVAPEATPSDTSRDSRPTSPATRTRRRRFIGLTSFLSPPCSSPADRATIEATLRLSLRPLKPALRARRSPAPRSAGERDLAQPGGPVRVEAARPRERAREQLPRHDGEERREQRQGRLWHRDRVVCPGDVAGRGAARHERRARRPDPLHRVRDGGQRRVPGSDRPDREERVERGHGAVGEVGRRERLRGDTARLEQLQRDLARGR